MSGLDPKTMIIDAKEYGYMLHKLFEAERKENKYRWHDAEKERPKNNDDVLICFSGQDGYIKYDCAYGVGRHWMEDGEWEIDGVSSSAEMTVHGWKEIEHFEEEKHERDKTDEAAGNIPERAQTEQ